MNIITIIPIENGQRYLVKFSNEQKSRVLPGPLVIAGYDLLGIHLHELDCDPQAASWIGSEPKDEVEAAMVVPNIEEYLTTVAPFADVGEGVDHE